MQPDFVAKAKRRATEAQSATLQRLSEAVTRSGRISGAGCALRGCCGVFGGKGLSQQVFFT